MLFAYTLRNLLKRPGNSLLTMLGVAATVAAILVVLAIVEGMLSSIDAGADPLNAVVLNRNVLIESRSSIPVAAIDRVKGIAGIQMADGRPLVSPERINVWPLTLPSGGFIPVIVRGVDAIAFQVHPGLSVTGRFPNPSEPGCVAGHWVAEKFKLQIGSDVRTPLHGHFPILGILNGPGSRFEGEIWCDRTAFMREIKNLDTITSIYVRLQSPAAMDGFRKEIVRDDTLQLSADWEHDFDRNAYGKVRIFAKAAAVVVAMLAGGAIMSCINTLYSGFLGQVPELATLLALGFKRRQVALLMFQQSVIVTLLGAILGIGVAFLANGVSMSHESERLFYFIHVSPRAIAVAAAAGLVIAFVGGLITAFHVLRLQVLTALRAS